MKNHESFAEKRLKESFHCPHCRGKEAVVRRVSIPSGKLGSLLPLSGDHFYCVICILCGHSDFYNESVYAAEFEESKAKFEGTPEASDNL